MASAQRRWSAWPAMADVIVARSRRTLLLLLLALLYGLPWRRAMRRDLDIACILGPHDLWRLFIVIILMGRSKRGSDGARGFLAQSQLRSLVGWQCRVLLLLANRPLALSRRSSRRDAGGAIGVAVVMRSC